MRRETFFDIGLAVLAVFAINRLSKRPVFKTVFSAGQLASSNNPLDAIANLNGAAEGINAMNQYRI